MTQRLAVLSLLVLGCAAGAASAAAADTDTTLALDLVVRDKKNALVADLRAEELGLLVDGTPHAVAGLTRPGGPRLVVFLFPRLEGIQRDLARDAAEEFLKKQLAPGTSVAVLLAGAEVVPVQGFTENAEQLKQAVRRALEPSAKSGEPDVRALYAVVGWLKGQPGRKTVLLFSSGLALPPGYEELAQELVGVANQQQVSFYGVDPRGIDVSRGGTLGASAQTEQESQGLSTELWGHGGGSRIGEDLRGYGQGLRPPPSGIVPWALAQLAQGTGGFVVEPTNSFSKAMRQIAEDAAGYYELRYTPTGTKPDGSVRKLEVRVGREGAKVQSRQAYRIGDLTGGLVPAFERQLAQALDEGGTANDVELWQRALHFGWDGREVSHVLWTTLPLEKVTLVENSAASRFEGDLAILLRVKDTAGSVVGSFSQRLPLQGPLDQLSRARASSLPFVRRIRLAPGEYVVETAVQDGKSEKRTVLRSPLKVAPPAGVVLSSLSLGDVIPAGGSDPEDPLRVGEQRLVPNLGQPIKAGKASMTLHSVVYPQRESKDPAQITITLLLGGQPANTATAPLPAPDASGKIAYATAFKMDVLPPGDYRFQVAVTQGASRAEEALSFKIVP
jgi:VWFA-related protein